MRVEIQRIFLVIRVKIQRIIGRRCLFSCVHLYLSNKKSLMDGKIVAAAGRMEEGAVFSGATGASI